MVIKKIKDDQFLACYKDTKDDGYLDKLADYLNKNYSIDVIKGGNSKNNFTYLLENVVIITNQLSFKSKVKVNNLFLYSSSKKSLEKMIEKLELPKAQMIIHSSNKPQENLPF